MTWQTTHARLMKQPRWKQALIAFATITLSWWAIHAVIVHFPIRSHAMNEYTKNMKTVCVVRYLIDVPSQFKLTAMAQSVNGIQIERLPMEIKGQDFFNHEMEVTERKLREELAKLEYSSIEKVIPIGETGRAIVYFREAPEKSIAQIDAYFFKGSVAYKLKQDTTTTGIAAELGAIRALAAKVTVRDNPTAPGLCIDGGFIAGKGFDQEDVLADFEERDNPGFGFSLQSTYAPGVKDGNFESKFDRFEKQKSRAMFKDALANIKTKRNTSIMLADTTGKEWLYTDETEGVKELTAIAETPGDGTHQHQLLELQMINGPISKTKPASTKLSDEAAISVWDAVIKSIRLRPGAL